MVIITRKGKIGTFSRCPLSKYQKINMPIKKVKKYLYIVSMLVLCFSCTKEKRSETIKKRSSQKRFIHRNKRN